MEDDRRWLAVIAALTAIELAWWAVAWSAGTAPLPFVGTYLALSLGGLAAALAWMKLSRRHAERAPWPSLILGAVLVGLGASLFLPLKYAIPGQLPFWLDVTLADAEYRLFGGDPWQILDRQLGAVLVPVDRLYALWLPAQTFGLFLVMVQPPSAAKSRALIAYGLAWFVLGVVAAMLCSSVGPIFYDRLLGGARFAMLGEMLAMRGAWVVLAESDAMWQSFVTGKPGFVAGISAFPSMHIAISLWLYLVARTLAPRAAPIAAAYCLFIWVASVQLGWHYFADGLAGAVGMLALWLLAAPLDRAIAGRMAVRRVARNSVPVSEPM